MATPPTGKPIGRPRGAKSKRTLEREKAMQEAARKAAEVIGEGAFEGDAHALLMLTYKDTGIDLATRIDAAKAAIAYEKPKLASIDQQVSGNLGYTAIPVSERDPLMAGDILRSASRE